MNTEYCRKHGLVPNIYRTVEFSENLNVAYSDMYWHSVFFGNFIPIAEVFKTPCIHIAKSKRKTARSESLFTLIMTTPDYPFRAQPEMGHFLHWMICNVPVGSDGPPFDTVVDYMPPLPTEYAGHFRYVFALFEQTQGRISLPHPPTSTGFPFQSRRNFFLHANRFNNKTTAAAAEDKNIVHVQNGLEDIPNTITFFHTKYDINVTEYYQQHGLEEPIYVPNDVQEDLLYWRKYKESEELRDYRCTPNWDAIWPATTSTTSQAKDQLNKQKKKKKNGEEGSTTIHNADIMSSRGSSRGSSINDKQMDGEKEDNASSAELASPSIVASPVVYPAARRPISSIIHGMNLPTSLSYAPWTVGFNTPHTWFGKRNNRR
jgi:phosphatidylethanolamine-binding protein (PEBP) family uncharacterized protein